MFWFWDWYDMWAALFGLRPLLNPSLKVQSKTDTESTQSKTGTESTQSKTGTESTESKTDTESTQSKTGTESGQGYWSRNGRKEGEGMQSLWVSMRKQDSGSGPTPWRNPDVWTGRTGRWTGKQESGVRGAWLKSAEHSWDKKLSSYPRTAFLSTDCLSTGIVYLPMRCLSTRIVFLPTDSSYLRIVFLPTDCLPTWSVSLHGLSSYQRILFLPTDLLFYSPLLACSKQHGHQVRHTPGAQSPGRYLGALPSDQSKQE